MNIRSVHQMQITECPKCYAIMHRITLQFHLPMCRG